MSKALILTTALCLVTAAAYAGGTEKPCPPGQKPVVAPTLAVAPTPAAHVITASVTTSAVSNSAANSAANSNSSSNATGGRSNANATGGRSTASTGPVTVNNGYGGQTRANTPDVLAPSISGGNPCTVGASGGLAVPAFGLSFGASGEGKNCVARQTAALLANMGMTDAAKEMLCRDMDVRYAMANAGTPCATDRQRWTAAGWRQTR